MLLCHRRHSNPRQKGVIWSERWRSGGLFMGEPAFLRALCVDGGLEQGGNNYASSRAAAAAALPSRPCGPECICP